MAAQIYQIIYKAGGQILFSNLDNLYRRTFGKALIPADYDFSSLEDLLSSLNFLILIRGGRKKMSLVLNRKLHGRLLEIVVRRTLITIGFLFLFLDYGISLPQSVDGNQHQILAKSEDIVQWPPPPVHDVIYNGRNSRVEPPKPDTPPASVRFSRVTNCKLN